MKPTKSRIGEKNPLLSVKVHILKTSSSYIHVSLSKAITIKIKWKSTTLNETAENFCLIAWQHYIICSCSSAISKANVSLVQLNTWKCWEQQLPCFSSTSRMSVLLKVCQKMWWWCSCYCGSKDNCPPPLLFPFFHLPHHLSCLDSIPSALTLHAIVWTSFLSSSATSASSSLPCSSSHPIVTLQLCLHIFSITWSVSLLSTSLSDIGHGLS